MNGTKLESVQCVKDLGVSVASSVKFSQRLARLNLFSLEKRRFRGKNIECFKILKGFMNVNSSKMFSIDNTTNKE